ncbi:MAG: hypothetical protein HY077_01140 [Elusimicrobia bacterium]|nr:hypothetical protein [Elusimicrobiota bacterium]
MRARLPAAILVSLLASARAPAQDADEPVSMQRTFVNLSLGDTLEQIQMIYPPAQEWPSFVEPRAHVKRYRVERTFTKYPAPHTDTMWLGLKRGRLVEVQLIYTAAYTRTKSVDALASDLALTYGEPRSNGGKFWWSDGKTVLRVFYAEVPVLKDGGAGVELRTSIQLLQAGLFPKGD